MPPLRRHSPNSVNSVIFTLLCARRTVRSDQTATAPRGADISISIVVSVSKRVDLAGSPGPISRRPLQTAVSFTAGYDE